MNGCFVCGHDHHGYDKNKTDEVMNDVRRVKEKTPKDFMKVGDMDPVVNMCQKSDYGGKRRKETLPWGEVEHCSTYTHESVSWKFLSEIMLAENTG